MSNPENNCRIYGKLTFRLTLLAPLLYNELNMRKEASGMLFGVAWYGVIIGAGMIVCIVLACFMAKKRGYYPDLIFDIAVVCIPCAIVGARLYYVINDTIHNDAVWSFAEICGFENGKFVGLRGLAIYGGLLGGVLGAVIVRLKNMYSKYPEKRAVTLVHMADLCFCLIILGQAIGRWGNFVNEEVYGTVVTNPAWQWFPFAIQKGGTWYHALFFYESLWNLIGFGILMWLYNGNRKSYDGFCFSFYCVWYGIIRFILEGMRDECYVMWLGNLRANQVISVVMILIGVGINVLYIVMAKKNGKKLFILTPTEKLNNDYYRYTASFLYLAPKFAKKQSNKTE